MFSGIVAGLGIVEHIEDKNQFRHIRIRLPEGTNENISQGASISLDGVCLTVVEFSEHTASFDIIDETLNRTTLSKVEIGDMINIERAMKYGALGGKLLGAGGGGFLLVYMDKKFRKNFFKNNKNIINIPFKFSDSGTQVIFKDER